jgi:tetratricopeptide (TPR) repeat protein
MKYLFFTMIFMAGILPLNGQNCKAFLYYGDTSQYEACIIAEEAEDYYQFSKEFQEIYDKSIDKCYYFASAYHAKSVAYLKSGDFFTWKKLIDKAVEFNPKEYLGYRGWCRYQFFRDYEGAIGDIERLDSLIAYNIGYSSNGDYHLNIAKAICYKALGKKENAIKIIEEQLADQKHSVGIYDYLHLGVLYLESGQFQKAINTLVLQEKINDIAENRFYIALAYKGLGQKEKYYLNVALCKKLYQLGSKMNDPYTNPFDKIYLKQIEKEIKLLSE